MTNLGLIKQDRPLTLPKYDILLNSKDHMHRPAWRNHFFTKIIIQNLETDGMQPVPHPGSGTSDRVPDARREYSINSLTLQLKLPVWLFFYLCN